MVRWGMRRSCPLLEAAYAKAHEDAAGSGLHAGFAAETLYLTKLLTEMVFFQRRRARAGGAGVLRGSVTTGAG
jgi:hypothetical protein